MPLDLSHYRELHPDGDTPEARRAALAKAAEAIRGLLAHIEDARLFVVVGPRVAADALREAQDESEN